MKNHVKTSSFEIVIVFRRLSQFLDVEMGAIDSTHYGMKTTEIMEFLH